MKSMVANLVVTAALGVAAALSVAGLGLEPPSRDSAWLGVGVSTAIGLLAYTIKVAFFRSTATGSPGIKALMSGQVLSFLLRLLAVGVGAAAVKASSGGSPTAFVLAFFAVYLGQQLIETTSLLANYATKSGVSSR
jgi:hypothetical protein